MISLPYQSDFQQKVLGLSVFCKHWEVILKYKIQKQKDIQKKRIYHGFEGPIEISVPQDHPAMSNEDTVNVLKFQTLIACRKGLRQTVQNQIRLLPKKQSDQGLPCLLF